MKWWLIPLLLGGLPFLSFLVLCLLVGCGRTTIVQDLPEPGEEPRKAEEVPAQSREMVA